MEAVQVVDFSAYSIDRSEPDPTRIQQLVDDVHSALSTTGFMRLRNVGTNFEKVQDVFRTSKDFFNQPLEKKLHHVNPSGSLRGYVPPEAECPNTNSETPCDLKEAFEYLPAHVFSKDDVPEFETSVRDLFHALVPLHQRILEVIARGLKLEDPNFFNPKHAGIGTDGNITNLRINYYPALTSAPKEGQMRCGEHFDFGSIALLFTDSEPGLEIKNNLGEWTPVPYKSDSIIVNIGGLMQRWTSDKLLSGLHRVAMPEGDNVSKPRYSIVFFGNPDNDVVVECLDDSNKYPPISALTYLEMKLNEMYK